MGNMIKYRVEIDDININVVKDYFLGDEIVAKGVYDRSYTYTPSNKRKKVLAAQEWASKWDGETFQVGADTSLLDDECGLISCCPIEKGVDDFQCSMVCKKSNCGAVLVMCEKCRTRYYDSIGCCVHNDPTACECQCL